MMPKIELSGREALALMILIHKGRDFSLIAENDSELMSKIFNKLDEIRKKDDPNKAPIGG
jgi:hypothetical protein